ncbi:Esterase TesA [BD1-7 clade bacterium]|uniref:Esterase TesA n=1 Tax=BD1-7 clade bacterium TaxID=2029982 RepID=A0A5S9PUX8_9GAMM|nr:Esterase TesA [BD1-7 clade bacterium]
MIPRTASHRSPNALILLTFFILSLVSAQACATRILVYGDSLSAGFGLEHKQDWPTLLQQNLDKSAPNTFIVINTSISGETTTGGLLRLQNNLNKHKPDVVVLELGANDGLRGNSLKTMRQNLNEMIDKSQAAGADVLLVGMHIPPNYGSRYSKAFNESFSHIADQRNIILMPFLLDEVALEPSLMQQDGLHPNAEAQPTIARNVLKYLKPLLQQPE